ncbi:hypothetical protein IZ6_11190 [Terrihabitans soli]|uniref:DUF2059 domain-containing protein n=1 Tax=Terrihabitans soli TaxID=708113 RepID=A0A6S6QJC5_9HYPH|nr:DUF2059 domain-containing protein [Terrihabitans soli]BCJ90384.1 hypothetical protein IZ6_11190 [Terrihabitans soli]
MRFVPVRRFGSAVLILCALSMPAFAQAPAKQPTPEHVALARAVLDFTGARSSFDGVLLKLLSDARNTILRTRPTLQPDLETALLSIGDKMKNSDEALVNEIALVYAQKFTEAELKDIAAFYQSPAGKKLVSEMPGVLKESYELMQEYSRRMSVDIMSQLRVEMKKKGHDL